MTAVLLVLSTSTAFAQTSTVTAAWDRNTDAATAGYLVHYGTAPGAYQWSYDAGNQASAQLTLTQGSLYYFVVRGYNTSAQQGPPSNEATIDLRVATPAPTAQITATLSSATSALVTWQTTNAASARINGTSVAASGSATMPVSGTTTFTLVATNAAGATATASATVTPTTLAPTAQITATLSSATSALVTWQTTNAASARINGNTVPLSGSATMPVSGATTFTLVATNAGGATATASATVTPTTPAPTAQITATLSSATSALVTWQTTNAASARINGNTVPLSGSATMPVSGATTFTLVATNAGGATATASATVTPTTPPAPTAQITATLSSATSALVTWQTTNAATARINGNYVAASGSTTMPVSGTTTFTLVVTNTAGATATHSATVTPTTPATPTAQVTATLSSATTALVTWQTTNAAMATLNGAAVALAGSAQVPVSGTTTFTLVASNTSGASVTTSATVTVAPPPPTGAPSAPTNVATTVSGARVTISWRAPSTGATPTSYLVDLSESGTARMVASGHNVGNALSVSTDLPKGRYTARVRAANAQGTSAYSNTAHFKVGRSLVPPSGFNVDWSGTTATLSWAAATADRAIEDIPTEYVLEAGTAPGRSDVATIKLGRVSRFSVPVPAGAYYVRLRAENAFGDSEPTADLVVAAPGVPGAPNALTAARNNSTVNLRWSAPAGTTVTGYVIEAGSAPGLSDYGQAQLGTATTFSTTAPLGAYYVRVRALNGRGPGLASNEVFVR